MKRSSEMPPTQTLHGADRPPQSAAPTSAQLKGDINSGRTGDKVELFDPGLSPLGTDDEAAGTPPSAERVAMARQAEGPDRWAGSKGPQGHEHRSTHRAWLGYAAGALVLGGILVAGVYFGQMG